MDLVLEKDVLDYFLVEVSQGLGAVQLDASKLGDSDADVRRAFVQSDPDFLELSADLHFLLLGLGCFNHHQHHIGVLCHCNDLSSLALALRGTLDNPRKIQKLNFGIIIMDDAWDAGESCELVGCTEGGRIGDAREEGGLADRRETDHTNSGISEPADFESFTSFALARGLKQCGPMFG